MKNIKQKIVIWMVILLSLVGLCIAQDSTITEDSTMYPKWDTNTIKFETTLKVDPLTVTANPFEFTVNTEALENNAPLQEMLECQNEQTDVLNQNLSQLNQTAKDLPMLQIEAKQSVLNQYGIDPTSIEELRGLILGVRYILMMILLLVWLYCTVFPGKYLYFYQKRIVRDIIMLLMSLGSIWLITETFIVNISKLRVWENIDKLF